MGKQARMRRERQQAAQKAIADTEQFIEVYKDIAPSVIYEHFTPDCCTNATRVLIDVASAFGVEVRPMAVRAIVMNAIQLELLKAHGSFVKDEAGIAEWRRLGAYSVVVDTLEDGQVQNEEAGPGWRGHLVGVVAGAMIDSSARQFSRPQYNMEFPDIAVMAVGPAFMTGGSASGRLENGVSCFYTAIPSIRRYEQQMGFQQHNFNMDVAREIVLKMDRRMPQGWQARSLPKPR